MASVTPTLTSTNLGLIPGSRTYRKELPPSRAELGASSWSLLHSIASRYPLKPSEDEKAELNRFLYLFSKVYPEREDGEVMTKYIDMKKPTLESRKTFGLWLSEFHNIVNKKLDKDIFDTTFWENRWVNGWD